MHPSIDETTNGDIKAEFLPPNVKTICQPIDQGVIEMIEYHHSLFHSLISVTDNNEDCIIILKKIDMLDVRRWVAETLEKILIIVITRSWNILLNNNGGHKSVWET